MIFRKYIRQLTSHLFEEWPGEAAGLVIDVRICMRLMVLESERSILPKIFSKIVALIRMPEISIVFRMVDIAFCEALASHCNVLEKVYIIGDA